MALTKAQKRIVSQLAEGGQIWPVSCAEEPTDDPNVFFLIAVFRNGEFLYTERTQLRTLIELRRLWYIGEDDIF